MHYARRIIYQLLQLKLKLYTLYIAGYTAYAIESNLQYVVVAVCSAQL